MAWAARRAARGYRRLDNDAELVAWLDDLDATGPLAVDTETDDLVRGLKRHWLLRGSFETPPEPAPETVDELLDVLPGILSA